MKKMATTATVQELKNLKWLCEFSEQNLDEARPGDWLNIKHELERFLGISEPQIIPASKARKGTSAEDRWIIALSTLEPLAWEERQAIGLPWDTKVPTLQHLPEAKIVALQSRIRQLLRLVTGSTSEYRAEDFSITLDGTRLRAAELPGFEPYLSLLGPLEAIVPLKATLLANKYIERLRVCRRCRKVFYRVRRQVNCSRRCSLNAAQEKWRNKALKRKG